MDVKRSSWNIRYQYKLLNFFKTSRVISKETFTPRSSRNSAFATQKRQTATSLFAAFTNVNNRSKSPSREVCSLGSHICNTSGQLKQDQVLSKWMGESWNLKNYLLKSQLNYIFQISNKIWNECSMNVVSYAQIAFKKLTFQAKPANAHV